MRLKTLALSCVLLAQSVLGQERLPQHQVPINQDIVLGELSVTLSPYQTSIGTGLLVNVTSQTPPGKIVVIAVIETEDGTRQQYSVIAAWLPSNTANGPLTIALPTKYPIVSISRLWLIPIDSDQLHAA